MDTSRTRSEQQAGGPERKRGPIRTLVRSGRRTLTSAVGEQRFLKTRATAKLRLEEIQGKPLLLIHTMGKVGSTTVKASLAARGLRQSMAVYQPHFVSEAGMAFVEKLTLDGVGGWDNLTERSRRFLISSHALNEDLARRRKEGKRVTVVTLVRDPVATNLSGLFHNHAWWPAEIKVTCETPSPECLSGLRQHFLEHYPHQVPDTWFDMEMLPLYGVDVYAVPFDTARGYQIYRSDFADVLLLKLEDLSRSMAQAFKEFMNLDDVAIVNSNVADDKSYAEIYQAFRANVALPESYLDQMYGTRFTRHFYTPDEVARFRKKWLAPAAARTPA